jgi:hypothetical protein
MLTDIDGRRSMRRMILMLGVTGALAAPVAARADAPTPADTQQASQECRFERGTTDATREAFRARYGTNHNGANAFGKCVSATAKEQRAEREQAEANAPQACRAEEGTTPESKAAFRAKYGTNKNGKNAFGKCVSAKARALEQQADDQDRQDATARKHAAKACDAERGSTADSRAAFRAKYGRHGHDAFGRCVSQTVKAGDGS